MGIFFLIMPLAQTCLSVCGEGKACIQNQWEQQHIQIMSRLPIPSRSRDGEGGLNRIDCHACLPAGRQVTSLLALLNKFKHDNPSD